MIRLILPALLLATACAGTPTSGKGTTRPDWVDGGRRDFPEEKYVVAVGSGKDRKAAENDAKRALAERFQAKVSSGVATAARGELADRTDGTSSGSSEEKTHSALKVTSSIDLRGIQVLRHFHDPATDDFFALAGIDRLKVRNSYQMELMKRKQRIDNLMQTFEAKPTLGKGREILDEIDAFDALSEEAEGVGAGMPVIEIISEDKRDIVEEKLEELRRKYVIELKVRGDDENEIEDLLGSCLTDSGLSIMDESHSAPTHKVSASFRRKDKKVNIEGWKKVDFILQITTPGARKKVVSKMASGRSHEHAFDQVRDDLIKEACETIVNSISK